MSDAVQIAIISMVGGVLVAYITNVVAKKVQEKKAEKQPKDRVERLFDEYERIIRELSKEDDRKAVIIREQQAEIAEVKRKLSELEAQLAVTQYELIDSRKSKHILTKELDKIRKEYTSTNSVILES